MALFSEIRKNELKQKYQDDFILSQVLYKASNNQYWQEKQALWTVLSAACNDAGKEFYNSLRTYVQNICDIDLCNIHNLKSMAKSVNCQYLTDFINENLPSELLKLINIFSISKSNLLQQLNFLNYKVTYPRGQLDKRNILLLPQKIYYSTIVTLKNKISKFEGLLEYNKFDLSKSFTFFDPRFQEQYGSIDDEVYFFQNKKSYKSITLKNIIDSIKNLQQNVKQLSNLKANTQKSSYYPNDQKYEFTVQTFLSKCCQSKLLIELQYKHSLNNSIITEQFLNPFFCLVLLVKNNFFKNYQVNLTLNTAYYDNKANEIVDLTSLILNLFETIQNYDQSFIQQFIYFHFYGLFYDKLINDQLKNQYTWKQYTPYFAYKTGEYSLIEFMAYTAGYMTQLQLTEFIQLNTFYKKCQIDFIQYLSILNSTLQPISIAKNKQFKAFSFIPYQFNNPFQISDNFNSEYRRLLNLKLNGQSNGDDLISQIARQFTDLCIKISYTREAVKQELQTYSIIGTNKIIQNSVRDFFLKNFSERKNWRYTANSTLKLQQNSDLSGQFISLEKLNNTLQLQGYNSQFFNVSMIQYFDPTNYLNIYSQLPETIIDYIQTSAIVPSTKVLTENYISTTVIGGDGLLSTIYDDFGFIAPQSGLIINDNNFTTANVGTQTIQIPIWNSNAISSVIIKPGTVVSSIITPGNIIQTTGIQYTQIPVYAPCTVLFSQTWNSQFWNKTNVNQLTYNQLSAQIKYYSTYFTQMNKLTTNQAKRQYYINQVYPKFKTIWQTFATSGFTNDKYYLGRPPGNNITKNIGNSIFPTIAPLQQLHNLIPVNEIQTNTLFLSKLFYNQTKYYLHLMTKQILNMHYYNKQTLNYGIPQQGWKRSYIEYKGYNTTYQESKNILPTDITPNKNIDADGPWVYSTLQKFISLYIKENNQISYTKLLDFVKSEYFVIDENIQINIANKLFAFQHEIYNKNQYNIHDFYIDSFQNQYTLFKHYQHNNYQDTGQIWVRMKNYQLSVPLMKLTYIRFNGSVYTFDEYDTMYCRQQISYVNMFKQLVNNAIQFGVVNNIIWILGRTTWTDLNGTLTQNLRRTVDTSDLDKEIYGSGKNYSYLKLVSAEFSKNDTLNTLQININSIKFYTTDSKTTVLNDINQFIGVYVDNKLKNINFVLYNKNLHISNILKNNVTIASDTIEYLKNSTMPLTIHSYSLVNSTSSEKIFYINNTQFPLINMCQEKFIVDFYRFKTSLSETYKITDLIDNSISGMVQVYLQDDSDGQREIFEIFGKIINVQDNIIITGNIKINEKYGQISANIQNYLDIPLSSDIIQLQNIYWYDSTLTINRKKFWNSFWHY